jgi:addiction module HigA family antidote
VANTTRILKKLPPIHPGEILLEDYMKPLGLSAHRLAMDLHVPATRIAEIIHGKELSQWTALFDSDDIVDHPRFWLNLQNAYDLE